MARKKGGREVRGRKCNVRGKKASLRREGITILSDLGYMHAFKRRILNFCICFL
jgi:hypothetical protein